MSWRRPFLATASGAAITFGSTLVSCSLALQVEKNTNRLFYWCAPQWYAKVDQAYGLTDEQLHEAAARYGLHQHPQQPLATSPAAKREDVYQEKYMTFD